MKNKEEVKGLEEKILKVERGTDWAWWLLIITITITTVISLDKLL